jgi:hypothetical protein
MIALAPAGTLESISAQGNKEYGNKQGEKGDAIDPKNGDVAAHLDGVGNLMKRGIHLRFDAQIVVTRRNAGDHHGVIPFSFGPGTVAIVAGVVADFAPEVPGLSGVLVDQRVAQIDPMIADRSGSLYFDV